MDWTDRMLVPNTMNSNDITLTRLSKEKRVKTQAVYSSLKVFDPSS